MLEDFLEDLNQAAFREEGIFKHPLTTNISG